MKKVIASGLIVLMIMSFCPFIYGAEIDSKLERGGKNLALGWTEIPKSVLDTTKEKNVIMGLTIGLLEGVLNAFARTVSGAAEVATVPAGPSDKPAIRPKMVE